MRKMRIFFLSVLIGSGLPVFGQTGEGNNPMKGKDEFTLENNYEGQLTDMEKPEIQVPEVGTPKMNTEGITYETREIKVETEFTPPAPKITDPKLPPWPPLYNNYVKVGFGRFATPLAKISLNNGRNDDADIGLDFTHLSCGRGHVGFAEFREDYGTLKGAYFLDKHTLGATVKLYNTKYYYFADSLVVNSSDTVTREALDTLRQSFTKLQTDVYLLRNYEKEAALYDVKLRFQGLFDRFQNKDLHFSILPKVNWGITEDWAAGVDGNLTFSNTTFDSISQSRFFLDLTPTVTFRHEGVAATGGLKINSFTDSSTSFSPYPVLKVSYDLLPGKLRIYSGLFGEMHYYSFYDKVAENKYLALESNIQPGKEKFHVHGGIDGSFAKYFNYSSRFYFRKVENELIYYNPEGGSRFQMVYDTNFRETGLEYALNFSKDNKIRAGVKGTHKQFKTSNISHNFAVPNTRVDFWGSYNFADKVWVTAEVFLFGKRVMTLTDSLVPVTQNLMADVNLYADYRFSKRFSVFLEVNNILGNRYFRWYNYQERPFDVKGGITLSF